MVFRFFVVALLLRLVLVGAVMALAMWLLLQPGYHAATLLTSIVLALLVAELWRYVSRTNREVARFLDAVRFADYSQRFDFEKAGVLKILLHHLGCLGPDAVIVLTIDNKSFDFFFCLRFCVLSRCESDSKSNQYGCGQSNL